MSTYLTFTLCCYHTDHITSDLTPTLRNPRYHMQSIVCIYHIISHCHGCSGFLTEHSHIDGTPMLRMTEYILATSTLGQPEELVFEVNGKVDTFLAIINVFPFLRILKRIPWASDLPRKAVAHTHKLCEKFCYTLVKRRPFLRPSLTCSAPCLTLGQLNS
jgi:hypothetical protein